jgi:hypothetical protein
MTTFLGILEYDLVLDPARLDLTVPLLHLRDLDIHLRHSPWGIVLTVRNYNFEIF